MPKIKAVTTAITEVKASTQGSSVTSMGSGCGPLQVFQFFLCGLRSRVILQRSVEYQVDVRFCSGHFHSGFHASNQVQRLEELIRQSVPSRRNLGLHCKGNPEIRTLTDRSAKEFARGDARNAVNGGSDGNCLSGEEWFVRESSAPPGVTGDGEGMASRYLIVQIGEKTAVVRHQPQYRKVASRNQT